MTTGTKVRIEGDASSLQNALQQGDKSLEKLGITAKQTAAAMRGVPAQFTDIFVSLQSGQNPMQVFFQQGGQLKDMFGGVGNAAKALGGYVLSLINPFSLGATAIAALGVAAFQGGEQTKRLENALIISGNAVGKTSSQLEMLAQTTGRATGEYSKVREAVEALALDGIISGQQLESALQGVIAYTELTGDTVQNATTKFEELAKNPVAAIVKLNEKYNFLTFDIYKQITALEDQGKHQDAVTLAIKTYSDVLDDRKDRVVDNAGYIEKAWRGIKKEALWAWDAMLGIGREKTIGEQLIDAQIEVNNLNAKFKQQQGHGGLLGVNKSDISAAEAKLESLKKQLLKTEGEAFTESAKQQEENKKIAEAEEARKNKKNKSSSKDDSYEKQLSAHKEYMQDLASLASAAQKLNEGEKSNIQQMQDKLNAYSHLEPATKAYLQTQIEIAKAAEAAKAAEKQDVQYRKELRDWDIEQAKIEQDNINASVKSYEELSKKLEDENAQLNVDLITDDKKRARAQLEIENQLITDKIELLRQEGVDVEDLLVKQTEVYEKQLKKIEQDTRKIKPISEELGSTFKSSFEDAIVSGKKLSDVLGGLASDIERLLIRRNITNPLMEGIDSIDWGNILGSSPQGSAGTGDGIIGWVSSLFGGGRASGGSVNSGKFYEVNENSPELITTGGKTFLMMGANNGHVTPPKDFATSISGQQNSAPESIQVSIENKGSPAQVVSAQPTMTPDGIVVKIMMDDLRSNGPITRGLTGTFGLRRGA